jgi:hypothetical protein
MRALLASNTLAYLRESAPQKLVLIGQPANQKSTGSPAYFCEADLEEDWLRSGCTVGMLLVSGAPIECHDLQFHDVPKPDFLKGESLSVHFCVVSSEGFPAKIPRGSALIITSAGC